MIVRIDGQAQDIREYFARIEGVSVQEISRRIRETYERAHPQATSLPRFYDPYKDSMAEAWADAGRPKGSGNRKRP
jgi:hypothetical protein